MRSEGIGNELMVGAVEGECSEIAGRLEECPEVAVRSEGIANGPIAGATEGECSETDKSLETMAELGLVDRLFIVLEGTLGAAAPVD